MKKIIIISTLLIILLGGGGWYYFYGRNVSPLDGGALGGGAPFGTPPEGGIGSGGNTSGTSTSTPGSGGTVVVPKLFKISSDPVSGALAYARGSITFIRYADRATGHIYDVNPVNLEKISVTNNTLPRIYEALWRSDGGGVIFRTLPSGSDAVENTLLTLTPPKSTSTDALYAVDTKSMRGNVLDMKVGPSNLLAYVLDTGVVTVSSFDGTKPQAVFSSPFTQWRIGWSDAGHLTLTTAASSNVPGFAYSINTKTASATKLLGPLNALTTLISPDNSHIAYSYNAGSGTKSFVSGIISKSSVELVPTTLVEKCAWDTKTKNLIYCAAPSGGVGAGEPDYWYQGTTHYSDRLWKFDVGTEYTELLADPKKNFNVDIDVESPKVSPDGKYLIFINRNDLSLWALTL